MQIKRRRRDLAFRAVNVPGTVGYAPDFQRHHILPRQLTLRPGLAAMIDFLGAEQVGIDDFRRNGVLLPATDEAARRIGLPLHRGPHRQYNEVVIERFAQIAAQCQRSRRKRDDQAMVEALFRIDVLQRALRRRLLDPARWRGEALNRRDPALDFSHLDRMADQLWGATEAAGAG